MSDTKIMLTELDYLNEKLDKLDYDSKMELSNKDNADEIKEEVELEEAGSFCPMCDSAQTYYLNNDTYDTQCHNCGHIWESDEVDIRYLKDSDL